MLELARRSLGVLLLVIVAAFSAEAAARIDDLIRQGIPLTARPSEEYDLKMRYAFGVRGRPNGSYERWHLNRYGFRHGAMDSLPAPGCDRIMVLGASETFGYYEPDGKEYPAQLADSLRSSGCVEVVNAAIVGMSLASISTYWDHYIRHFQPRIVIIYPTPAFYLGATVPRRRIAPEPFSPIPPPPLWRLRMIQRFLQRLEFPAFIQRRRVAHSIATATIGKPTGWLFRDVPAGRLSAFAADLDTLVTSIQASGATPVLVTHASRFGRKLVGEDQDLLTAWRSYSPEATESTLLAFEDSAAGAMRREAQRRDVALVDVASEMAGKRELFVDFAHFTPDGSARVAGFLADAVRSLLERKPSSTPSVRPAEHPRPKS